MTLTKDQADVLSEMIEELYREQNPELGNLTDACNCIDNAKDLLIDYIRTEDRNVSIQM